SNVIFGLILIGTSFAILNLFAWTGVLVIGMLLMTLGEMIAFPFSNAFAMDRTRRGNQAEYIALYSIAFSLSHVFSHHSGMHAIAGFGYPATWNGMVIVCLLGAMLLLFLKKIIQKPIEK